MSIWKDLNRRMLVRNADSRMVVRSSSMPSMSQRLTMPSFVWPVVHLFECCGIEMSFSKITCEKEKTQETITGFHSSIHIHCQKLSNLFPNLPSCTLPPVPAPHGPLWTQAAAQGGTIHASIGDQGDWQQAVWQETSGGPVHYSHAGGVPLPAGEFRGRAPRRGVWWGDKQRLTWYLGNWHKRSCRTCYLKMYVLPSQMRLLKHQEMMF